MAKLTLREDGVDHIHVATTGKTIVGRICAVDLQKNFTIPGIGEFLNPGLFAHMVVSGKNPMIKLAPERKVFNQREHTLFRHSVCLAKFFQICQFSDIITQDALTAVEKKKKIDLQFCNYRFLPNGLREMRPMQFHANAAHAMVKFLVSNNQDKSHFNFEDFDYIETLAMVNRILKDRQQRVRVDMKIANIIESIHQAHESLERAPLF